ncbi:MAG: polysaccharide biosynthesis/export family protein [Lewinellaceae bacterium]|nr:polysaccharide biosynthesis/export family protein [Lewinellaceae bacterium]
MRKNYTRGLFLLLLVLTASSCVYHKQLVNFKHNGERTVSVSADILNQLEPRIQPADILYIQVTSYDQEAAQPFNKVRMGQNNNMNFGGNNGGLNAQNLFGYMVNYDGYIDFPVVGRVAVAGLTQNEARNLLLTLVKPYLTDAVVNVQFLNFKFTIMGEVGKPSTYTVSNPRITILEAIGMAGDLTLYANRTNILVIREVNGVREYGNVDLQSPDLFASPYYYLSQNDVIYIEPLRQRIATVADPAQRIIGYVTTGLSILSIVLALTRK